MVGVPSAASRPQTASAIVAFAVSNELAKESGLLTVTVMGIILANQNDGHYLRYYTGFARDGEYAWRFDLDEAGLDPSPQA